MIPITATSGGNGVVGSEMRVLARNLHILFPMNTAADQADRQKVRVEVTRKGTNASLEQDLALARVLAKLMDSQFQLGPVKFGLDSVVGLVPVAGDLVSAAVSMYPMFLARKHGLGKRVVARMMFNIAADFGVGLVPLLGDVADVYFKANLKNLKILEEALEKRRKG